MERWPLVVDACTLTSQLAKSIPRWKEVSIKVSRLSGPMLPD
jgi:hypothetical protein